MGHCPPHYLQAKFSGRAPSPSLVYTCAPILLQGCPSPPVDGIIPGPQPVLGGNSAGPLHDAHSQGSWACGPFWGLWEP